MRSPGATVRKRLVLLMGGFFLLFVCVMARLVDLQAFQAQELTERGMNHYEAITSMEKRKLFRCPV